ncbi:hypothetical protein CH371_18350 [Leptospira wolffii]|uniref:Uncharacterized protein n=2 Tax=Leptospira wolffii TaxID=409998 RepID=A0A2M9Z7H7_9LEPT|nr:hypothetical protein CH371_18350 [Leptospira wolffii]
MKRYILVLQISFWLLPHCGKSFNDCRDQNDCPIFYLRDEVVNLLTADGKSKYPTKIDGIAKVTVLINNSEKSTAELSYSDSESARMESYYKVLIDGNEKYIDSLAIKYKSRYRVLPQSGITLHRTPENAPDSDGYFIPFNTEVFIISEDDRLPDLKQPTDDAKAMEWANYYGTINKMKERPLTHWVKVVTKADTTGWTEESNLHDSIYDLRVYNKSLKDILKENSFLAATGIGDKPTIQIEWKGLSFKNARCRINGKSCDTDFSIYKESYGEEGLRIRVSQRALDTDGITEIVKEYSCKVSETWIKFGFESGQNPVKTLQNCVRIKPKN